eukprot:s387_g22.t1
MKFPCPLTPDFCWVSEALPSRTSAPTVYLQPVQSPPRKFQGVFRRSKLSVHQTMLLHAAGSPHYHLRIPSMLGWPLEWRCVLHLHASVFEQADWSAIAQAISEICRICSALPSQSLAQRFAEGSIASSLQPVIVSACFGAQTQGS